MSNHRRCAACLVALWAIAAIVAYLIAPNWAALCLVAGIAAAVHALLEMHHLLAVARQDYTRLANASLPLRADKTLVR